MEEEDEATHWLNLLRDLGSKPAHDTSITKGRYQDQGSEILLNDTDNSVLLLPKDLKEEPLTMMIPQSFGSCYAAEQSKNSKDVWIDEYPSAMRSIMHEFIFESPDIAKSPCGMIRTVNKVNHESLQEDLHANQHNDTCQRNQVIPASSSSEVNSSVLSFTINQLSTANQTAIVAVRSLSLLAEGALASITNFCQSNQYMLSFLGYISQPTALARDKSKLMSELYHRTIHKVSDSTSEDAATWTTLLLLQTSMTSVSWEELQLLEEFKSDWKGRDHILTQVLHSTQENKRQRLISTEILATTESFESGALQVTNLPVPVPSISEPSAMDYVHLESKVRRILQTNNMSDESLTNG